jgi:ATP-dependent helicase/nuclease subunit A
MSAYAFKLYSSSAGSGKTYTLTKEYLSLVLVNPHLYRHILAVTFTNKATEEMKGRIISKLNDLRQGEQSPLATELQLLTQLTPVGLQERAGAVLKTILHDYSRFAVSTIDSFFQRVLRSFAHDSLQRGGYRIELDQEKVLEELTRMILLDVGKDEALRDWLTKYARSRIQDESSWDFRKDLLNLASEIFKEDFMKFEASLQPKLEDKAFVNTFLAELKAIEDKFESTLQAIGKRGLAFMDQHGVHVTDFSYGESGVAGYFTKMASGKPSAPGSRVLNAVDNPENWYGKKSPLKDQLHAVVTSGLHDILIEGLRYFSENILRYNTTKEVKSFIYGFGILSDITRKLQQYRDDNDVLLISDVARFLKDIIANNDAPYIYEKVGATYQHYLIDEFQDTSTFQWDNFRPLIENSLGQGNTNLIVGDVKQSIYRWRGGDWTLLLRKASEDLAPHPTTRINLTDNWRSKKNVIDFNNAIFRQMPLYLQEKLMEDVNKAEVDESTQKALVQEAEQLGQAYADAYQHFPASKKQSNPEQDGLVHITYFDRKDENEESGETTGWKEAALQRIPVLVEELQDKGYSLGDIAFLVRTGSEGSAVAQAMMDYKNLRGKQGYRYDVVSSEALYLGSSSAVKLLVSTLRFMRNAADKLSAVYLVQEYRRYVALPELCPEDLNPLFGIEEGTPAGLTDIQMYLANNLPEAFTANLPELSRLPLFELSEALIRLFELNRNKNEYAYLQSFQDAVLTYSKTEKTDLSSFLHWWQEKGYKLSVAVSEGQDAIRILTVHKSKGLQFKIVIIPFCSWSLDKNYSNTNILWGSHPEKPFSSVERVPVKYRASLLQSYFAEEFVTEKVYTYLDSLNTLYVALTRAEEGLFLMAPRQTETKEGYTVRTVSDLMATALREAESITIEDKTYQDMRPHWNEEEGLFSLGGLPAPSAKKSSHGNTLQLEKYLSSSWREKLTIKPQAKDYFKEEQSPQQRKVNFPQLAATLLANMQSPATLPDELNTIYFQGQVTHEEKDKLESMVSSILQQPDVAEWYGTQWQARNSPTLLSRNNGTCKPDRVLTLGQQLVAITFVAELTEGHVKAMQPLANMFKKMGYSDISLNVYSTSDRQTTKVG